MVTSGRWEEVSGFASWSWYDWNGTLLASNTSTFTVPSLNNSVLYTSQGLENILPNGANAVDVWMHLNITAEVDNTTLTNEQFVSIFCFLFFALVLTENTLVHTDFPRGGNFARPSDRNGTRWKPHFHTLGAGRRTLDMD